MAKIERIYHPTEAGLKARDSQVGGLPPEYRRVLGFIQNETHSDVVRAGLRRYSDEQIFEWLGELETLGLVVSEPVTSKHDLDFTDSFNLSTLLAAHKAA